MNLKKLLSIPSPYTVIAIVILLAAVATWLLPAGAYQQLTFDKEENQFVVTGQGESSNLPATQESLTQLGISISINKFTDGSIYKPIAVPGTYSRLEAKPQGAVEIAQSPVKGIYEAMDVILFVLIIGGFIGVFKASGMFEAGIAWLARKLKGRESWLIIIVTTLIALGGTTFGMAEETLAFYPILVPIFLAAGYDALVPVAVIYTGSSIGTMFSTVNPFSVIIASDAAGVNWTNGLEMRLIMLLLGTAICIWYLMRYAALVKADPTRSMLFGKNINPPAAAPTPGGTEEDRVMDRKKWVLAALFAATFIIMIVGVSRLHWWFLEMTTLFLVAAIVTGFLMWKGEKLFINSFIKGAEEMLGVAIIIGLARGVTIILNDGQVSDTLLYNASNLVQGMPAAGFIISLVFVYIILTIFISSSSGMAVLTMPIMGPLANVAGIPPEHVVNAYLVGFGLMSFITPTGLILPSLVMVDVSFGTWLKFIMPLLGILLAVSLAVLMLNVM
jgi:uncharacterized ion transporter superfamily protein YfcC